MDTKISFEDRYDIYETLAKYVWCMDTGDLEGVVATFTPDGIVKDFRDTLWDASKGGARGFAANYINPVGRLGGQHWVQHIAVEDLAPDVYRMTSYWYSANRPAEGDSAVSSVGRYMDTCVKVDGRWLIREKIIDPWHDESVHALGLVSQEGAHSGS